MFSAQAIPQHTGELRCSGSNLCSFNCTWTLRNFSTYDFTIQKSHRSASFFSNRQSDLRLFLIICPGGDREVYKEHVACYLHVKFPDEREKYKSGVTMIFSISLCIANGDVLVTRRMKCPTDIFASDTGHGFPSMMKREELLPKLSDDTLVICVEGLYSLSAVVVNENGKYFSDASPFVNIGKVCEDLSPDMSDAHICVEDIDVPVNSTFLTACSKVFAAMFQHDTAEKKSRRIEVEDFDIEIVRLMVEFIHVGRVMLFSYNQAMELLRAADKYELEGLKTVCTMFLLSHIDNENFADILVCSDKFNALTLKREAIEYVCKNRGIIDVEEHDILLDHPKLLRSIVKAMKDH